MPDSVDAMNANSMWTDLKVGTDIEKISESPEKENIVLFACKAKLSTARLSREEGRDDRETNKGDRK